MSHVPGVRLLTNTEPDRGHDASRLVVFIHGYGGSPRAAANFTLLARELWGRDVDILAPHYPAAPTSNADPAQVAREIADVIAHTAEQRAESSSGYDSIVLTGFSAGSMLIRKAFVYGMGSLEDHPYPDAGELTARKWQEFVLPKVERVVLLAGINRGWSYRTKPKFMSWRQYLTMRFGVLLGRLRAFGRFYMATERGRPFIANLRVQWIRLVQAGTELPPVIQLLGELDTVVRRDDHKDVLASRGFVFVPVSGATHGEVMSFDGDDGAYRKELVAAALSNSPGDLDAAYGDTTERLRADEAPDAAREETNLVFLMHGIRANADWPNRLARLIEERSPDAHCVVSSYGYFPMLRFLLFGSRRRNVRWFMDRYTEELAKVQGRAKVHFVGHSNGTHLLAESLRTYATIRVDRVALMGSVVPSQYRWDALTADNRVGTVRNDRASGDFVVGVFPGFLHRLGGLLPLPWFRDIGDGGFRGFDNPGAEHQENFYFRGGHSAAYKDQRNLESIADFIVDGTEGHGELVDSPSKLADWMSRLNWAVWIVLVAALVLVAIFFVAPHGAGWVATYIAVVLLLLLTV